MSPVVPVDRHQRTSPTGLSGTSSPASPRGGRRTREDRFGTRKWTRHLVPNQRDTRPPVPLIDPRIPTDRGSVLVKRSRKFDDEEEDEEFARCVKPRAVPVKERVLPVMKVDLWSSSRLEAEIPMVLQPGDEPQVGSARRYKPRLIGGAGGGAGGGGGGGGTRLHPPPCS